MNKLIVLSLIIAAFLTSCGPDAQQPVHSPKFETRSFAIKNLSDQDYPDNPDIGFRSKGYHEDLFEEGRIAKNAEHFHWDFSFLTKESDTILLKDVDVSELIPTIPDDVKSNEYLSYISCVNQEWNRNQVKFIDNEFLATLPGIVRVDLARNCLNAYLWEVILYIEEEGQVLPYSHGWFDFPHDLYAQLFEEKNDIPFTKYKEPLENWIDPESKGVDLSLLREVIDTLEMDVHDRSDNMYPLKAARKKKFKEIIYPETFSTMRDLQSDSTLFATFTPPGFYNRKDPRTTELGRIHELQSAELYQTEKESSGKSLHELQLSFSHKDNESTTTLVVGGIDFDEIPVLEESEANKGWKNSMGIGNHSFYESYEKHIATKAQDSPYYGLILDEDGKWLDSHKVGIDGPIFHFSDQEKSVLHLWILSFERHALVGHYEIAMK